MTVDLQAAERYNRTSAGGEVSYMQLSKTIVVWQKLRGLTVDGKAGPMTLADIDSVGDPCSIVPDSPDSPEIPGTSRAFMVEPSPVDSDILIVTEVV